MFVNRFPKSESELIRQPIDLATGLHSFISTFTGCYSGSNHQSSTRNPQASGGSLNLTRKKSARAFRDVIKIEGCGRIQYRICWRKSEITLSSTTEITPSTLRPNGQEPE